MGAAAWVPRTSTRPIVTCTVGAGSGGCATADDAARRAGAPVRAGLMAAAAAARGSSTPVAAGGSPTGAAGTGSARAATGDDVDIHNVMIATQAESLAFQTAVQVRNKLVEAYQDVFRMQM